MTFPGATDDRDEADYVLVGAPLDISASFHPGARFGPDRIRHYAEAFEDYDHLTGRSFSELGVHDAGDVRAWDDAAEYLEFLTGTLADVVRDDAVPLLVGGEHIISVAGVRATEPDVFVCLDAHLDLREAYDGNPHSHATVTHHALSVAEQAVILGARSGSEDEWERAGADDVTVVPPEDVAGWTPDYGDDARVYCSVDVDAADPSVAPGTGTMEPFGLTSHEMHRVVRAVAPHAVGFDVVEVNDRDDGQAAVLAAKLLRAFVFGHAEG